MPAYRINWSNADWSKQDVVLARELGCSRERVRQARQEFNHGVEPSDYRKRSRGTIKRILEAMNTEGKTLSELSRILDCSGQRVAKVLTELGKAFKHRPGNGRHDWSKFPPNWKDLTDKEIAELVGVNNPSIVTQWRNRHGKIKTEKVKRNTKAVRNPNRIVITETPPYRGDYGRVFVEAQAFGEGKTDDFIRKTAKKLHLTENQIKFATEVLRNANHTSNGGKSMNRSQKRGYINIVKIVPSSIGA